MDDVKLFLIPLVLASGVYSLYRHIEMLKSRRQDEVSMVETGSGREFS